MQFIAFNFDIFAINKEYVPEYSPKKHDEVPELLVIKMSPFILGPFNLPLNGLPLSRFLSAYTSLPTPLHPSAKGFLVRFRR